MLVRSCIHVCYEIGPTLAYEEPLEVLCNQPACRWSAEASCESFGAVRSFKFHTERTQHVDAPACPGFPILLILRHRSRNFAVYQPMASMHIVIVSTRAWTLCDEGANMFDGRKATRSAAINGRRHDFGEVGEDTDTRKRDAWGLVRHRWLRRIHCLSTNCEQARALLTTEKNWTRVAANTHLGRSRCEENAEQRCHRDFGSKQWILTWAAVVVRIQREPELARSAARYAVFARV